MSEHQDHERLLLVFVSVSSFLPRDATQSAVLQVVRLSVTLRYPDHIGWKSSKIITRLVSLVCSLSADSNITDLLQGEHPEILAGIGEEYRKSGFWHTKALISLKRGKIGPRLLLRSSRKSYTRFRLVLKSMTLDDLKGHYALCFKTRAPLVLV